MRVVVGAADNPFGKLVANTRPRGGRERPVVEFTPVRPLRAYFLEFRRDPRASFIRGGWGRGGGGGGGVTPQGFGQLSYFAQARLLATIFAGRMWFLRHAASPAR